MMTNTVDLMIIIKGEIKTNQVANYRWNVSTQKHDITFKNGKMFSYLPGNVIVLRNPKALNPDNYMVWKKDDSQFRGIERIYEFKNGANKYWRIEWKTYSNEYKKSDLVIHENCLAMQKSGKVFEYLKEASKLSNLTNEDGELILRNYYEKLGFVSNTTALYNYLEGDGNLEHYSIDDIVFPFGCNQSQYKAVRNALENQISIIQGPPGTGKTQTILNIIANLIVNNKSVIVVSNNNSATANVLEKLSKEQYGMDFLVASLGSMDNKKLFIESQTGKYPDLSRWKNEQPEYQLKNDASTLAKNLQKIYKLKEDIANLKLVKHDVDLESKYYDKFYDDNADDYNSIKIRGRLSSEKVMNLWQEIQDRADRGKQLGFIQKLKSILVYGIANWDFYNQDVSKIIFVLQKLYYKTKRDEIDSELNRMELELQNSNAGDEKLLEQKSLIYLKKVLERKYNWEHDRTIFTEDDLYRNPDAVVKEYPIILSTTFSARSSLNSQKMQYDYVIMDEASQVDVATGALALSCAKNAVIVGDLKQLSNVVTPEVKRESDLLYSKYSIEQAYDFGNNSFLKSVSELLNTVPKTLLKEHYRCNPRIIGFCNEKFYDSELIIMTDDTEEEPLKVYVTTPGNHARGFYNQRQIDVIKNEILPELSDDKSEIGIVAPYNEQVNAIKEQIPNVDVATVHKYQGREKDVIIITVVNNDNLGFMDQADLLNVAISRAKKRLIVVVANAEQQSNSNIADLISYIRYNKMDIVDSKVYSVFDYMYNEYAQARWAYFRKHRRISQFESENLTHELIKKILRNYPSLDVTCFVNLQTVIKDASQLTDEEARYAFNPSTHLDFLVYRKIGKEPLLAVETDGYKYHKVGTAQHERDIKKNDILEKCGLKLLRLPTNGSQESSKITIAIEECL